MASADVEYCCFIDGLAWATDSRSLEQAFNAYGEVLNSKAMKVAIEGMNGQNLDERNITVNEAQSHSGDGGGGGFRSGGGSYDNGGGYGGGRHEGDGYSRGGGGGGHESRDREYGGGSDGGSWRN